VNSLDLRIKIHKNPFYIKIQSEDGKTLLEDFNNVFPYEYRRGSYLCRKKIKPGEKFFGFGEKTGKLEKRGSKMIMWNTDYLEKGLKKYISQDPLYISIPFFISVTQDNIYALFFDNPGKMYFDMGKGSDDHYEVKNETGEISYYFIYGKSVPEIIERFTRLTGRIKMPPLWSLGYHQSRWGYDSSAKVLEVAGKFRQKEIPCDCIHLDIDHMNRYMVFTWDKKRFTEPEKMIKKLTDNGFKTVVINDPGVKVDNKYFVYNEGKKLDMFCKDRAGRIFSGKSWPGKVVFPDFFKQKTRNWWGGLLKKYTGTGIEGFWNDMNEPANSGSKFTGYHLLDSKLTEHRKVRNAYGQMMARSIYDGLNETKRKRYFVLSRSGFAGIQKYSAVWTGDCYSRWADLRASIPMILNLGLSGVPFAGTDVGGFRGNTSKELFIRWMQFGIFQPLFRNHSEKGTGNQEPWSFDKSTEKICRELIMFRYRLLPYIYSLFYESYKTGSPILRPLFYHYPQDEKCYLIEDQFLFGENILAAPISYAGRRSRQVYLPKGDWIDFQTNKTFKGGKTYQIKKPLNEVIMFIKKGSIIPLYDSVNYIGEKKFDKLYLNVYPGNGEFNYYMDDGKSYNYEKGEYSLLNFVQSKKGDKGTIEVSPQHAGYRSELKELHIKYSGKVKRIKCSDGKVLDNKKWYYYPETDETLIILDYKFPFNKIKLILEI
ncbi:TIM-barrel domain-containing protein, partial [candidate division KSB1 bacterium]